VNLENISSSQFEKLLTVMQQPFPALTCLKLWSHDRKVPVVPASSSFLGGSAPRLQTLCLEGISFPGLPELLLCATHLVHLNLRGIPHSGFISPDAMVTGLSALTRLENRVIIYYSPRDNPGSPLNRPYWKSRRPPPPTRTILPVLTKLQFEGVDEYLEDLVARIDVPLLNDLEITFPHQLIYNTSQLIHFINRTPKFKKHDEARVFLPGYDLSVTLPQTFDGRIKLGVERSGIPSYQHLSSLVQVCSSFFPQTFIRTVEHLHIGVNGPSPLPWLVNIKSSQWLEVLRLFPAVKDLYITQRIAPRIARALRDLVRERVTEVLPSLQTLYLEEPGPVQKTIEPFIAARQLAGHPVAISPLSRRVR
jgi:hypothetical protein